jgi:hypothetical protein
LGPVACAAEAMLPVPKPGALSPATPVELPEFPPVLGVVVIAVVVCAACTEPTVLPATTNSGAATTKANAARSFVEPALMFLLILCSARQGRAGLNPSNDDTRVPLHAK